MNDPPIPRGDGEERLADLETHSELRPAGYLPRSPTPKLGPYRLLRLLGRGGMGEVYLAHDEHLDRQVAVKRIRPEGGQGDAERRRFRREAKAAARLSHPAIVHVYDLRSEASGDDYLVLEYVAGQTLAERLAQGPLDPAFAVARAAEIAEGLAAAHEAGFLHRDLKAGNVMLTPDGHAKILDFGLVRSLDAADSSGELTRRDVLVGTCHAMSPEQAACDELDARSDLFSLGSLLYEMLTGKAPFRGENHLDTLRRVAEATPRPLRELKPELPPELERLIAELLAKRREDRPSSAREVAARLAVIAAQLGATAAAVTWSPRPQNLLRLRKRGVVMAAACLAGALWGTFVLFVHPAPLRVAIPSPVVNPNDVQLVLAADAALTSVLRTLASLEGVVPIDPSEADRGSPGRRRPSVVARLTAADDVLSITLIRQDRKGKVTLRRIAADGRMLSKRDLDVTFDALSALTQAVASSVQDLYPNRRRRSGSGSELKMREQDLAEYSAINALVTNGKQVDDRDLYKLEKIVETSPESLDPYLLASRVARYLFRNWGEQSYLEKASELVQKAQGRFPDDDVRLLRESLQVKLASNRPEEAEKLLATLAERLPNDPELLPLLAQLYEQEVSLEKALEFRQAAVRQAPSWQNLYWLAVLEAKLGDLSNARQHLRDVHLLAPDAPWPLEQWAEIEVYYGDLDQGEKLYEQVARETGRYQSHISLGFVRSVKGDYQNAILAYQEALKREPNDSTALFNLAEAYLEIGKAREANDNYLKAFTQIEQQKAASRLSPQDAMLEAKCLARLGRALEATARAYEILQRTREREPRIVFDAAEVYALVSDRNSALIHAQAACEGGIRPRLFTGSAWKPLLPYLDLEHCQ